MGVDRRLLKRHDVEVSGELIWETTRRLGKRSTRSSAMTTIDISFEGMRIRLPEPTSLRTGDSCLVCIAGARCLARVVNDEGGSHEQVLCLRLEQKDQAFIPVLDRLVPRNDSVTQAIVAKWQGFDSLV